MYMYVHYAFYAGVQGGSGKYNGVKSGNTEFVKQEIRKGNWTINCTFNDCFFIPISQVTVAF